MTDKLYRILEVIRVSLYALLATEPKLIVLAGFLYVLDLFGGAIMQHGRFNRKPLGHIKESIKWLLRWGFAVVVLTTFANGFTVTGWIVEVTYITVCGQLVRRNFQNMTTAESDIRQFFESIWTEVRRRNLQMVGTDQDPDSDPADYPNHETEMLYAQREVTH